MDWKSKRRKRVIKRVWKFIWEDDSLLSWIVNILLAFLIIKFLLYPGLGLIVGTNLPVVAVISQSMNHEGNFDAWWGNNPLCAINTPCTYSQGNWYLEHNITKEEFKKFPLHNGFRRGDVIVLKGIKPEKLGIGDIIVFDAKESYPVIHRIFNKTKIGGEAKGNFSMSFNTKGDHNPYPIQNARLNELHVEEDSIRGKALFKIPYIGYIRLIAADLGSLFH